MTCPFCSIATRKENIIFETRNFIFLTDKFPVTNGHCLLVSKRHVRSETDLSPSELIEYTKASIRAYAYVESTYGKAPLVFVNPPQQQSVPHLHKHVIPGVFGILGVLKALKEFLRVHGEQ